MAVELWRKKRDSKVKDKQNCKRSVISIGIATKSCAVCNPRNKLPVPTKYQNRYRDCIIIVYDDNMFNTNNILSEFKNITSEVAFTQEQEFNNGK